MAEEKKNDSPVEVKAGSKAETSIGLDENLAAAVAYIPIVGLVFLFLEKQSTFVRFHAVQSVLIAVSFFVIGFIPVLGWIAQIFAIFFYIFGAIKAYGMEKFKFPFIGDIAEKQSTNLPA